MSRITFLAVFSMLFLAVAAPIRADVTPADVKAGAEEKRKVIEKNTREAGEKLTTENPVGSKPAPAAPRKRKRFFDPEELHKDRSGSAEKAAAPAKPAKRRSLSEELHKDRSQPAKAN